MAAAFDVTLAHVEAAQARIAGRVRRTPSWRSPALSARLGREVFLKLECLAGDRLVQGPRRRQQAASALARGRSRGVVTVSGGNHAIAVARGAAEFGIDAKVLMPKSAARYNVEMTRSFGAEVELCDSAAEAFARANAASASRA